MNHGKTISDDKIIGCLVLILPQNLTNLLKQFNSLSDENNFQDDDDGDDDEKSSNGTTDS